MKVTPVGRKFGKYAPGDVFSLPDKTARLFIKVKKLAQAKDDAPIVNPFYATRMLTAAPVAPVVTRSVDPEPEQAAETTEAVESPAEESEIAPYGYKADGTPRKRPGRPASAE